MGPGAHQQRGRVDVVQKLDPRLMMKNPVMFVVEVGACSRRSCSSGISSQAARGIGFELQITLWLWVTVLFANFAEAMAEGRGKAQADTLRKARTETVAHRLRADGHDARTFPRRRCARTMLWWCEQASSSRRTARSSKASRRWTIRDHRRIGAGDSRIRRRPFGGHGRHARAVRLDQGPRHLRSGPHVSRSDDRARRGRRASEDAERDRAEHPARGTDDHLSDGGRHAAAVRDLFGRAAVDLRAGVAAGLPDPHDDWRTAVGHRHRRHGPADSAQRAGDVGARGRGGRRR